MDNLDKLKEIVAWECRHAKGYSRAVQKYGTLPFKTKKVYKGIPLADVIVPRLDFSYHLAEALFDNWLEPVRVWKETSVIPFNPIRLLGPKGGIASFEAGEFELTGETKMTEYIKSIEPFNIAEEVEIMLTVFSKLEGVTRNGNLIESYGIDEDGESIIMSFGFREDGTIKSRFTDSVNIGLKLNGKSVGTRSGRGLLTDFNGIICYHYARDKRDRDLMDAVIAIAMSKSTFNHIGDLPKTVRPITPSDHKRIQKKVMTSPDALKELYVELVPIFMDTETFELTFGKMSNRNYNLKERGRRSLLTKLGSVLWQASEEFLLHKLEGL